MPRYAILYHQMPVDGPRSSHWDLLLESGDVLRTWALQAQPSADHSISAERLADHRMRYLDYEGPVSGNRGSVTRWDAGTFQWMHETRDLVKIRLQGGRLVGLVTIARGEEAGGEWVFRYRSQSTSDHA